MKKLIITTLILCFCNSKAQFVDPGTQTQLLELNFSMATLLTLIEQSIEASNLNKDINEESKLLSKENLNFVKDIEDKFKKASSFIKTGKEIKDILDLNINVVKKIQELYGKFNTPFTADFRTDYMKEAYKELEDVGKLVRTATDLLADDKHRMTTEGRIEYLKGIRSDISDHERNISNMLTNVELWNEEYHDSQRKKELLKKAISKAKGQTKYR